MAARMKATKCPSEELSLTNCAIVSDKDFNVERTKHLEITTGPNHHFIFTIKPHPSIQSGTIGFSAPQRKWAMLSIGQDVGVKVHNFNSGKDLISNMLLEVNFLSKKNTTTEGYDTDKMAVEFLMQFPSQAFTVGQEIVFSFLDKKMLLITVVEIHTVDMQGEGKTNQRSTGVTFPNTALCFERAEGSPITLTGKCKGKQSSQPIISPNWNFSNMGVGGLDTEVAAIFRRAFASRVFPAEVCYNMGLKHTRGILMYGPPGTGKTLMARQIGKMLNAREPKIINGPEILDKYVGESEANIRKLFAEAEEEEKRMGPNSGLHIIILDELDAICKARGTMSGSTAVHDTIVNQLLSKIDGVNQLNNILVIGMTNRKDMIDEALLRPGRLEVQLEIGLPDEHGRLQILNIHTSMMRKMNKLGDDVSMQELAAETKNFSGAEIEGLVRAATFTAMNSLIKASSKVEIDPAATDKLKVCMNDFRYALANDIKPAHGVSEDEINRMVEQGVINWGEPVTKILNDGDLLVNQCRTSEETTLVTALLHGVPGCGKTALAAHLALKSNFPFLKICRSYRMIGLNEPARVQMLKKTFDDAYKSTHSCIILDDIEGIIEYVPVGPRFSNSVLQALRALLNEKPPKGRKLLVLATTSSRDALGHLALLPSFQKSLHVSCLHTSEQLTSCLEELNVFTTKDIDVIARMTQDKNLVVGVKKVIEIVNMVRKIEEEYRVGTFLSNLEEEGALGM